MNPRKACKHGCYVCQAKPGEDHEAECLFECKVCALLEALGPSQIELSD